MMKRNLIILLLLGVNINLFSQDNTPKDLRLGIFSTIDNIINSKSISNYESSGYLANDNETNYKIGLSAEYFLKNGFSLNSGFNYSTKNIVGPYYCATCFPAEGSRRFGKVELQFIEIPVSLRYYFLPKKLKIYASIGLINLYEITNENVDNKYSFSGQLGGGIEYNLNSNLAIQTITEYNRSLTNIFKTSDYKIRTISFGLGIVKKI